MNTRPLNADELRDEIKNIRDAMANRSNVLAADHANEAQWRRAYDLIACCLATLLVLEKEDQ